MLIIRWRHDPINANWINRRNTLTVWFMPHINTLKIGSFARNNLTFWCLTRKCFFFIIRGIDDDPDDMLSVWLLLWVKLLKHLKKSLVEIVWNELRQSNAFVIAIYLWRFSANQLCRCSSICEKRIIAMKFNGKFDEEKQNKLCLKCAQRHQFNNILSMELARNWRDSLTKCTTSAQWHRVSGAYRRTITIMDCLFLCGGLSTIIFDVGFCHHLRLNARLMSITTILHLRQQWHTQKSYHKMGLSGNNERVPFQQWNPMPRSPTANWFKRLHAILLSNMRVKCLIGVWCA